MSLLMDALKKAELAKRKAQLEGTSSAEKTSVATPHPLSSTAESVSPPLAATTLDFGSTASPANYVRSGPQPEPQPAVAERLELVADAVASKPASPQRTSPKSAFSLQELETRSETTPAMASADAAQQRDSVQNLFESKQGEPSRKTFAIVVGVCTLLAAAAIGVYFWLQLQPQPGLQQGTLRSGNMALAPHAPGNTPISAAETEPNASASHDASSQVKDEAPAERDDFAARQAENDGFASRPPATPPAKKVFRVTSATPLANPSLDRAYDALMRDDNVAAKAAYEQVVATDPKNVDALAGLAVIAQRAGNQGQAADYYLQILDADPRNATALSGLINLQSRMSPGEAEGRIRQALATQPDSPALNFSLGNVFARSNRWNDAQQSYFKAVSGDPGNPDYLFNLAVSLEQIHQQKLAANYYAQAVAAAGHRPSSFDKAQASERLQQLQ